MHKTRVAQSREQLMKLHHAHAAKVALCIFFCLTLCACGFQLRSSAQEVSANGLKTALNDSVLNIVDNTILQKHFVFARQLDSAIYQFYSRPLSELSQAYQLDISDISYNSYDAAINYNRATTRQELNYNVSYTLLYEEHVIATRQINIKRFLNLSPGNPNSSTSERVLVNNEIFEEAANRITQQINYLLSQPLNLHSN